MSKNRTSSMRRVVAGALLLAAGLAHADAVYTGAATAQFSSPATGLQFDNNRGTTATPAAYLAAKGGAMATSLVDSLNGGTVESTALGSGGGADGSSGLASASSQLVYRVNLLPLLGAPLDTRIDIHVFGVGSLVTANAGGLSTATYSASAFLTVQVNNGALIEGYDYADASKPAGSFVVDTTFSLFPGEFFDVALLTITAAGNSAYAQAFVDPIFTIDPRYASMFQLVGIPGAAPPPTDPTDPVDPTPPTNGVPEPSTWMLLAAGILGLMASCRRQRDPRDPARLAAA